MIFEARRTATKTYGVELITNLAPMRFQFHLSFGNLILIIGFPMSKERIHAIAMEL